MANWETLGKHARDMNISGKMLPRFVDIFLKLTSWQQIYEVLPARMTKLITARMLGNARKDHSITLPWLPLHDFCSLCLLCRNFFLKFEEKCTALVV